MDTSGNGLIVRRRRRTHSAEFKAKVVSACRKPGVSIAAVALSNGLNANLLRRWVVTEERAQPATSIAPSNPSATPAVEHPYVHSNRAGAFADHDGAVDHDRAAARFDRGAS